MEESFALIVAKADINDSWMFSRQPVNTLLYRDFVMAARGLARLSPSGPTAQMPPNKPGRHLGR